MIHSKCTIVRNLVIMIICSLEQRTTIYSLKPEWKRCNSKVSMPKIFTQNKFTRIFHLFVSQKQCVQPASVNK